MLEKSHITYYMHFYSDVNIFGMSEMIIKNFRFRRNFDEGKMRNFQKIRIEKEFQSSPDNVFEAFDLVDLEASKPQLFSLLS